MSARGCASSPAGAAAAPSSLSSSSKYRVLPIASSSAARASVALGREPGPKAAEGAGVVALEGARLGVQMLEENVEIANRAEQPAQPGQLAPQRLRPVGGDEPACRAQQGTRAPGRDAQLVQRLDVLAEPDAGVVREHRLVLLDKQPRAGGRAGRRPRPRRAPRRGGCARALAGRRLAPRAGLAERLAECLRAGRRSPLTIIGLDLRERGDDPARRARAEPLSTTTSMRSGRGPTATPARRVRSFATAVSSALRSGATEQVEEGARRSRAALLFQLEAADVGGQLELPDALAVLDPAAKRDPASEAAGAPACRGRWT